MLGEYFNNLTKSCSVCNGGYVAKGLNPTLGCQACQAGKYFLLTDCQTQQGSSTCWDCPALTYSPDAGATACLSCAFGWFPDKNQTSCVQCGAGTYESGPTTCAQCKQGYFSSSAAQSSCQLCSNTVPGSFANGTGQSSCSLCPQGRFSLPGFTQCEACPLGQWNAVAGISSRHSLHLVVLSQICFGVRRNSVSKMSNGSHDQSHSFNIDRQLCGVLERVIQQCFWQFLSAMRL